jgi:hypothetical protein
MNLLPFIKFYRGKSILSNGRKLSYDDLRDLMDVDNRLYIYDFDAIKRNKPNLSLYQKLSESYEIWVDAEPVDEWDVVDFLMAGANTIVLRDEDPSKLDLYKIRELTDMKILKNLDNNFKEFGGVYFDFSQDYDGFVLIETDVLKIKDFKFEGFVKKIAKDNDFFVYDNDSKNITYWRRLGVQNYLVPIEKIKEFKKYAF